MTDKNRCSNCGEDFYRVEMFDRHRSHFEIVGSAQVLVGHCIPPQLLGYEALGGTWYDSEGVNTYEKLAAARASRGRSS